MLQTPQDELSLRDVVAILGRHRRLLWAFPLVLAVVALIYAFFIAEPRYASTATVNVAPVQVQAQLEQRIQVQGQNLLTFEGLRAIAFSEEVTREVWEALRREGKLPTAWQDQGGTPGLERMVRDFKIKNESPRQQAVPQGQVPPVVASLAVEAPVPEVAARAANLWAEAVTRRANRIPLARLEANLQALEEQLAPAERAYREAQGRWEAFQRATTLAQDQAELDAKTGERVSLDQELSALDRDLAAVRGRVEALRAEARRQAALVPIGTSPEQLAIMGRRLREAQENLRAETERARQSYVQVAQVWEAFRGRERLPLWQAELSAYVEGFASAQSRLLGIRKELAVRETQLREAQARLEEYRAELPGLSLENLVAGLTVKEAEALVAERLREADGRLKAAEAAWQAYQRESQLAVLKQQLGGFTDRVAGIRQRLNGIVTERARVQEALGVARQRFEQFKAELPGLSLENLVAGLTVKEAEALVAERLKEADGRLKAAEAAWQAYQRESQLAVLKQQLGGFTDRVAGIRQRLNGIVTERARVQEALGVARQRFEQFKAELPGLSLENLVAGLTVKEAEALVAERLREADGRLKAAEAAWQAYQRESQLAVLKQQLGGFTDRVAGIRQRLERIPTERAVLQRRLAEAEAELAKEPKLLALEREVVADPAVAAVLVRGGDLQALVGLKLRNQELNPTHQKLLFTALDLRADLAALEREEAALRNEASRLEPQVRALQERIAEEEARRARLATELDVARDIYNGVYRYAENLRRLAAEPDTRLREVSPDVLRFRDQIIDLEIQLAALEAEERALRAEEARLEPQVRALQERIAEEEARRARLATELDVARDIYNGVYRYAENLRRLAAEPDTRLREVSPDVLRFRDQIIDLEIQLAALEAEERALRAEEARLEPQVRALQERIAEEEARRARLATELDVARDIYNGVYRYAENLRRLAAEPDTRLREVSPDVLRFRDQVVALEAERAALEAERQALERNLQEYERRIQSLRTQIAAQEREKEAILLEYNTKKAAYEAFRSRYDQIANLTAQDLAFDNPNPEYQRLRSVLIDAQAEEARLSARRAALQARLAQVEGRIVLLRERVAQARVEQDRVNQALELAKNAYLALSQKKTDLQIELASSQNALAQVIAPAFPVYEKVAPRRGLILALAVALGLVLGVMAAFVAEALKPPRPAAAGSPDGLA